MERQSAWKSSGSDLVEGRYSMTTICSDSECAFFVRIYGATHRALSLAVLIGGYPVRWVEVLCGGCVSVNGVLSGQALGGCEVVASSPHQLVLLRTDDGEALRIVCESVEVFERRGPVDTFQVS